MSKRKMLSSAIAYASEAHKGDYDKGGSPYILHPLRVMNTVKHLGFDAMTVAVLHDVIEDSSDRETTKTQVHEIVGHENIARLLKLTHRPSVEYKQYITGIRILGGITAEVKMADIKDNMRLDRLKGFRKKDFDRMEKYSRAYSFLKTGVWSDYATT